MEEKDVIILLEKYRLGRCTPEENAYLESWYNLRSGKSEEFLVDEVLLDLQKDEQWAAILKMVPAPSKRRSIVPKPWIAIAASLVIISVGTYFLLRQQATGKMNVNVLAENIMPGSNKAVLILASGKQIVLTDAKTGKLADEDGTAINKGADGEVTYDLDRYGKTDAALAYNTMTTPRGGQYHLTLADGTGVWLNAASSIKYPAVFKGNERVVEITGEAYFEVAHNAAKPFRVKFNGQTVEVLGTHFNINAYADEPTAKTTLLEGRVKLTDQGHTAILSPGQEGSLTGDHYQIRAGDVEQAVAWKNGLFHFDDTDLKTLMRQVARWYDVQVEYEGKVTEHKFLGDLHRNRSLSNVLEILEQGGIRFRIEGRKLIVTP